MRYCGVVPVGGLLQLAMLEEERTPQPPVRLSALFFEPGSAAQVAGELRSLREVVVGVGAPSAPRGYDDLLRARGIPPARPDGEAGSLLGALADLGVFTGAGDGDHGLVPDGAYRAAPVFETNPDGVFCALQGRRLPAKRHPHGMRLRIHELEQDRVVDEGGALWHRRSEEIDAAGAALCAHRYAVGHASWLGRRGEAVVVLPGSSLPERFGSEGVLPPVERLQLQA
jgi:uncharacterized protein DUF429